MKTKSILIPAVALAAFTLSSGSAMARSESPLVRLAHDVEEAAEDLQDEFREHFRHSGAYRHLISDASSIIKKAEHIDHLSHDPYSSLRHIKSDLHSLDKLAYHLRHVVEDAERGRYSGHVDGSTRHVYEALRSLDSAIHRMERYVDSLARADDHHDDHDDHAHGHREFRINTGGVRASIKIPGFRR